MPLSRAEQQDLGTRSGYVREVALLLDGVPVVWARSATPLHAIQGPWRAIQGLGTRPLAELLFEGRRVERAPLRAHHLVKSSPLQRHARNQWLALAQVHAQADVPRWARSSVFWHKGQPLRVMEAFSPWVCSLSSEPSHVPDARVTWS
jgi:chorismate--pyruvate lyase